MKNNLRLTLVLLLTAINFYASAQNAAKATSVQIPSIPFPLTWDTAPIDYKVSGNNSISITAGKETDFYTFIDGNYYSNNVPKLLFKPDSNFTFSAKIRPEFDSVYDGGAIFIYSDSSNWAKLLFEKNDKTTLGVGASVVKNKKTDDSYHELNSKEVYVKISKAANVFCFYYSADGKNWKIIRTFGYDSTDNMRIGFYSQSPKGKSCKVFFSDIKYKGKGFTNFFTGE